MCLARSLLLVPSLFSLLVPSAQAQRSARDYPIIDMHLHAMRANSNGPPGAAACMGQLTLLGWDPAQPLNPSALQRCERPVLGARTDEELMRRSLAIMERENIIGVTSGPRLAEWRAAAPERTIPGLLTAFGNLSADSLRTLLRSGQVRVLAEVTTQYRGLAPNAPELQAYWAAAEEFDVPVGIHMGSGPPGMPMMGPRTYRAANGKPLLLEDVLVRHPKLRLYVMHAGFPYSDNIISLMLLYPQVYVDIGVIAWAMPRPLFHQYLKRLVDAGLAQRVMFGSDQMVWPEAIEETIRAIESAEFLSPAQKRDLYYENARRFLRLGTPTGADQR
jgi:predicted TIM-barrel fold metal-dependent hydrolase